MPTAGIVHESSTTGKCLEAARKNGARGGRRLRHSTQWADRSEKQDRAEDERGVADLVAAAASGVGPLGFGFGPDHFTDQVQALGQGIVRADNVGAILLHQQRIAQSILVGGELEVALAVAVAELDRAQLVSHLSVPAVGVALLQRPIRESDGAEADGGRADAARVVVIKHALEARDVQLAADVPGKAVDRWGARATRSKLVVVGLDRLLHETRPDLAAYCGLPFVAHLALEARLPVVGQSRGVRIDAD